MSNDIVSSPIKASSRVYEQIESFLVLPTLTSFVGVDVLHLFGNLL